MVIDLFGLTAEDVRRRFPEVYQHVKAEVKEKVVTNDKGEKEFVGRDWNNRETYRNQWWIFGPRKELRPALEGLPRYIATVETASHRVFQFLEAEILPDNMLICIALSGGFGLGVLSSRIHVVWTLNNGATLEDRPRYSKSRCFDPFPFPDCAEDVKTKIREVAEELDAHRKARQAAEKARLKHERELARADQQDMTLEIEAESGKPRYPTEDELAETAAVMSVLATAARPVSIDDIAGSFAQGKQIRKRVALTILALARLGHLASTDGGENFSLRRSA